jgi:hypothetical protein
MPRVLVPCELSVSSCRLIGKSCTWDARFDSLSSGGHYIGTVKRMPVKGFADAVAPMISLNSEQYTIAICETDVHRPSKESTKV